MTDYPIIHQDQNSDECVEDRSKNWGRSFTTRPTVEYCYVSRVGHRELIFKVKDRNLAITSRENLADDTGTYFTDEWSESTVEIPVDMFLTIAGEISKKLVRLGLTMGLVR